MTDVIKELITWSVEKNPENSHLKIFKTKNCRLQSKCAELYNQNKLNVDLKSQDLWKNKKQNDYWVI